MHEQYTQLPLVLQTKRCTKCGEAKSLAEFSRDRTASDGYSSACKACRKIVSAAWYANNSTRAKEASTKWRKAHLERCAEKLRKYRAAHPDRMARYHREYYVSNKEKVLASNKEWLQAHPDKAAEYAQTSQERNREHNRVLSRGNSSRWRNRNPETVRNWGRRRRAKLKGVAINDLTMTQWREQLEYFNYSCAYCLVEGVPMTQDHILPISRGGNHTISNVVPACLSCNSAKHDLLLARFLMKRTAVRDIT